MTSILPSLMTLILFLPRTQNAEPCEWNPLCTCRKSHHDVVCRSVPFANFPQLPRGDIYQVTIIRSGVSTLENSALEGTSVASLHLIQNNIVHISPRAFKGLENLLTTLDLSHNQLNEVPFVALRSLKNLQWLNLQGNLLSDIQISHWSQVNFTIALASLFLGANHITIIGESAFTRFSNLMVLNLDGNYIYDIDTNSLPNSITSLSLSNNILKHVPLHAVYTLKNLRYLHLSENLLRKLPCPFYVQTSKLEKLDLSNNLLSHLQECIFNGSFSVRELYLDFNFIKTLPARVFKFTYLERLSVTNNRILKIHSDAFAGIELTLTNLDLGFNLMEEFPSAINDLKSLLYLSLKSNYLKQWNKEDLHGCRKTLEVLDLSGNSLLRVPNLALQSLMRLSLQDNNIEHVYQNDFQEWGHALTTLSLANNKMKHLSKEVFFHLKKLRELKLSFNNLIHLDETTFFPLHSTLEVLELSSAFFHHNYPLEKLIEKFERLEFLLLDNNDIIEISSDSIQSLKHLMHFEISNNNLKYLPRSMFKSLTNSRLSTVHISSNKLGALRYKTFYNLNSISRVLLFNNYISLIEKKTFMNCSKLHTIILSDCNLTWIDESAFYNLSRLSNLYLQDNHLELFSFSVIEGNTLPLNINLSNNFIETLVDGNNSHAGILNVKTLDLSKNKVSEISESMLGCVSKQLQHLFLSNNRISNMSLIYFPNLQVLHLSQNAIGFVDLNFSECCPQLQVLALDYNFITIIESKVFWSMKNLRILDLSWNKIMYISEEAFTGTKIEKLNLSGNYIKETPSTSISQMKFSLRQVDLSFNKITSLPSGVFSMPNMLQALNLSSNQITSFHELSFQGLSHLLELDLSHNELRSKFREVSLKYLPHLRALHLNNCSLMTLPTLTLPQLRILSLKDNFFYNISLHVLKHSSHLEILDLAGNFLKDVPSHLWKLTNKLLELDVSNNPISSLTVDSFLELERLQRLDIRGLSLKWLDPRTLHGLKFLTVFKTNSYASVRSFRLQDLLSHATALRSVTINIEESTLSHQIQGAFGTKLRELVITGSNLQKILPDSFSGLSTHELTIRICGTLVSRFPIGLLRYLSDVRYLTLDLRRNKLTEMSPGVLAEVTRRGLDNYQTQHITGGVLLEDNPWICSCELLWMGKWLRRWLRETFHVHMLSAEATLYVNSVARKAKCSVPGTNTTMAIVDLRIDSVPCRRSGDISLYSSFFATLLLATSNFVLRYVCFDQLT